MSGIVVVEQTVVRDWLHRVQAEYLEMPGLQLTRPQILRLWGLDDELCDALLEQLIATHFLRRTEHNAYVLHGASH